MAERDDLLKETSFADGVAFARVEGEIDLHNAPQLRDALLDLVREHQPTRVELDLGEVPYMDSSALAVLVEVVKEARKVAGDSGGTKEGERRVKLVHLQPRVQGLMHIARLDAIFDMPAE